MMMRYSLFFAGASATGPALNFLPEADCGTTASDVKEDGVFDLSIAVAGAKGFTYNCSAAYDPAVGFAEGDCLDWIPARVLSDKEGLDITLLAHDVNGKQAMCMRWELSFDGRGSGEKVWAPPEESPDRRAAVMDAIADAIAAAKTDTAALPDDRNNTKENRVLQMHHYLDSMTKQSHRCVPKGEPGYWRESPIDFFPNPFNPWAFPPTAKSVLQVRLGHAMLAATGTIWSIDRSCKDAWNINIGKISHESCVPTVPGFPHCHVDCKQTWHLGPGGIASWGIRTLNHLIRSPSLMLADDASGPIQEYGDLGCGDTRSVVV
jgi:hypothetical protein